MALYLPLIKSIALSFRETERGIDRDMMGGGGGRTRNNESLNEAVVVEGWIDRDDTDGEQVQRGPDSDDGVQETWWVDVSEGIRD